MLVITVLSFLIMVFDLMIAIASICILIRIPGNKKLLRRYEMKQHELAIKNLWKWIMIAFLINLAYFIYAFFR